MDHRSDFPELKNAVQYVKFAKNFFSNPPEGTLKFVRPGGDIMLYHPESNIFGVITAEGSIRTLYKPTDGMQYWRDQVALWGGGQE